ncbi:unnamed protein product [Peronospora belbahrii]|uniref:Uncharacterized protein n=1 Tax=Peronospora belbahrii TaxID=622444 RepID=A0AAU9KZX9_9STRA|nr:unnamed protein product [Peronospora belbahrii]
MEETTEVTEVTTETIETTDVKPEETTEVIEVTEVITTETTEDTVDETDVTEGKKPKSKKHRKPKRKPTAGTTDKETTEVLELIIETTKTKVAAGKTSTSVDTETREEIEDSTATSATIASTSAPDATLIGSSRTEETDEDGSAGSTVKTEVFRLTGANGSIVTKTVRTTIRKVTTPCGLTKRMIEVQTTTETKTAAGKTNTSVETETREEIEDSTATSATIASTSASDATLIGSSRTEETDEDGSAGSTVKTEVFRLTGANGSIVTKTVRTTIRKVTTPCGLTKRMIEVQTTTETKTAAGKTNTSVETETREEIEDSTATSATIASTSASDATLIGSSRTEETDEDGSAGSTVKTEVFRLTGANGSIVTKTVRTTIRKVTTPCGLTKRMIEVQTTTETKTVAGKTNTSVETETREEEDETGVGMIRVASILGTDGSKRNSTVSSWEEKAAVTSAQRTSEGSAWWKMKRRRLVKTWLPEFVSYVQRRGRNLSKAMPRKEMLNFSRDFCDQNFVRFEDGFFNSGTYEEKRASWTIARSLSFHYPGVAVQQLGLGVGKFRRTLLLDEVCRTRNGPDGVPFMEMEFVLSVLQVVRKKCAYYEDVLILENGEVLFHGTGESLIIYFQELGFVCAPGVNVSDYLLNLTEEQQMHHQVTMIQGFNNQRQLRRSRMFAGMMKFADDMVLVTGAPGAGGLSRTSTPASSPARSSDTAKLSVAYSPSRRRLTHRFAQGSPAKSPLRSQTRPAPKSSDATKGMKITACSSPDSGKTAKLLASSSSATGGSIRTRKIVTEGDDTMITTEITSPHGTKRLSTIREPTTH